MNKDRVIELAMQAGGSAGLRASLILDQPETAWVTRFYELAIADYIKRIGEPVLGRAEREHEWNALHKLPKE
jgi:hypothetical protein